METGDSIPDTLTGTYCLPIRACTECDTVLQDTCEGIYFVINLERFSMANQHYLFTFGLSDDLKDCYRRFLSLLTFNTSSQMPGSPPFLMEDVLEEWANTINAGGGGYVQAYHPPGSEIIVISFHQLAELGCRCSTEEQDGTISIGWKSTTYLKEGVTRLCCDQYEIPSGGETK